MRRPILLLPLLSALAIALATFGTVAHAQAPRKPGRSLTMANATGTTLMLEEMRRADEKRRNDILRLELESERRERSDRVVIFGVVVIAVAALVVVEKQRRAKKA